MQPIMIRNEVWLDLHLGHSECDLIPQMLLIIIPSTTFDKGFVT